MGWPGRTRTGAVPLRGRRLCPSELQATGGPGRSRTDVRQLCGLVPGHSVTGPRRPRPDSNGRPAPSEGAALSNCATRTCVPADGFEPPRRVILIYSQAPSSTRPSWLGRSRTTAGAGALPSPVPSERLELPSSWFVARRSIRWAMRAWRWRPDSNRRLPARRAGALARLSYATNVVRSPERTRTCNPRLNGALLSRLSYRGMSQCFTVFPVLAHCQPSLRRRDSNPRISWL